MSSFQIPLIPKSQKFTISLGGINYKLTLQWNSGSATWILGIYDKDQNPIVTGVPLVTGADLLEQLNYLRIGGSDQNKLIVANDDSSLVPPGYSDLGVNGKLYFVTP
jgi:hypothetical protein